MDDFTPYGCDFQESLSNLCKALKKCVEMIFSLSPKKYVFFFINARTSLGHSISKEAIQVDPNKTVIIKMVHIPKKKEMSEDSLDWMGIIDGSLNTLVIGFTPIWTIS